MAEKTVLVVDDDADLRKLMAACLQQAGFGVLEASTVPEAVNAAYAAFPDLIITDVMLPGESGYSLCAQLKADRPTRHIPIVVFSVLEGETAALEAGASAFLSKPVQPEQLVALVQRILLDDPHAQALEAALISAREGRLEEALTQLESVIKAQPTGGDSIRARYLRGQVFERSGREQEAEADYQAILQQDGRYWRAHDRLGLLNEHRGEVLKALRHFERSLALNPEQPDIVHRAELLRSQVRGSGAATPAGEAAPAEAASAAPAAPSAEPKLRIIVVDDDPSLLKLLTEALRQSGYEVESAAEAEQALVLAEQRLPAVFLLDAVLPGLSGLDACKQIKGRYSGADAPPVVLMSGVYRSPTQREYAMERFGADAFLAKPFSQEQLAETLRVVLSR